MKSQNSFPDQSDKIPITKIVPFILPLHLYKVFPFFLDIQCLLFHLLCNELIKILKCIAFIIKQEIIKRDFNAQFLLIHYHLPVCPFVCVSACTHVCTHRDPRTTPGIGLQVLIIIIFYFLLLLLKQCLILDNSKCRGNRTCREIVTSSVV